MTDSNKKEKAKKFVEIAKKWNQDYGNTGHVLITFGDDFKYQHAERYYDNLDILIKQVQADHPEVNMFYSFPHCYIHEAKKNSKNLQVRTKDYFPLWTGYYSSRPNVKHTERQVDNLIQIAKQLEVWAPQSDVYQYIEEARNELGVLQVGSNIEDSNT